MASELIINFQSGPQDPLAIPALHNLFLNDFEVHDPHLIWVMTQIIVYNFK